MAVRYRYRISCQPTGLVGVDRYITIFVGVPTDIQKRKQKGLWHQAPSKEAADQLAEALTEKAQNACSKGRAQTFLDHWNARIDHQRRTQQPPDWP